MDAISVEVDIPAAPSDAPYTEAFYAFDTDKVIHVMLMTDDLVTYDASQWSGVWTDQNLADRIEPRLDEVEGALLSSAQAPGAVLHLVLVQGVGRRYFVGFQARPQHLPGLLLVMTAADLEVIAHLELADQLALWRYARAHDRVRKYAQVFSWSQLDEFNFYRSRSYSYYASDEARPSLISMSPDGAAALKAELGNKYDIHGVSVPDRSSFAEVALVHSDRAIPIYALFPPFLQQARMLLESRLGPIWITAPPDRGGSDPYRLRYFQFVDLVAYWLWQVPKTFRMHRWWSQRFG